MNLSRLKHASLDDSIPKITGAFVAITLLLAFFVPTDWNTWKHWDWGSIVGHFVVTALGVLFVWSLSFGCAEIAIKDKDGKKVERSRAGAYAICVMAVLSAAVVFGGIIAAPVEPGDEIESTHQVATEYKPPMPLHKRDALIEDLFFSMLLPSLFGVRCALGSGSKPKKE